MSSEAHVRNVAAAPPPLISCPVTSSCDDSSLTPAKTKGSARGGSGTLPAGGTGARGRPAPGGTGLGARLDQAVSLLSTLVSELDPDRLSGADATSLYGSLAGAERLVLAGKALLAPRIEASGVWRDSGHRDAASLLASVEGVSAGQARRTLAVGQRLGELPGTEQAVRRGQLSGPKVTELTGAGIVDPTREADLLAGADSNPWPG
jgi:hypothetical protein